MRYENTYAVAVKRSFAKSASIKTISDLQKIKSVESRFYVEFIDRQDGYKGLQENII